MKISAKNIATSILAVVFLTACAGGRKKQAVTIEAAPGSKQPASEPGQTPGQQPGQQEQKPGEQPGQEPGQEQINAGGEQQPGGGTQPQPEVAPPSNPGSGGSGSGGAGGSGGSGGSGSGSGGSGTTDLTIEATLDDGTSGGTATPPVAPVTPGTSTAGTWDGKSFKGSGKWKVDPVN